MTTWDDVLRQACEVAGGERYYSQYLDDHLWGFPDGSEVVEKSKALEAYVAELLVAMIEPHSAGAINEYERTIGTLTHPSALYCQLLAPAKARILAAMVALNKLTLEQAREVT